MFFALRLKYTARRSSVNIVHIRPMLSYYLQYFKTKRHVRMLLHMHKYKRHASLAALSTVGFEGEFLFFHPISAISRDARVCLSSILHHLWHLYLNNTTFFDTVCGKHSVGKFRKKHSSFLLWSLGSTSVRGRRGGGKTHILPSCLKRFINQLNVSEHNLFSLPSHLHPNPSSCHVLGKTPRQWFKLNGVCQTCQLIKWGFALSMHFSVTALFHRRSQLSTPSYSQ